MKKAFRIYVAVVLLVGISTVTAFAADDPLAIIDNLSEFIFGLIRAIGLGALFRWVYPYNHTTHHSVLMVF